MVLTDSVVVAVLVVLELSVARVNVVISLVSSALIGGIASGMSLQEVLEIFSSGIAGGAKIALNSAILDAFAATIAHSSVPTWLSRKLVESITRKSKSPSAQLLLKVAIVLLLILAGFMSQHVLPVHIAFIPILIPPLLGVFAELRMDRGPLSNAIAFVMVTTYAIGPYGFGNIFQRTLF